MTIAEQMANAWCMGRPTPSQIVKRINRMAERGRKEAVKALGECEPNREYPSYIQEEEAEFHILNNKWEEEDV